MKKVICLVLTITLIIGSISSVSAATWDSYFGLNKGWYEGMKATMTSNTATGWTVKATDLGWGGCWGGQVFRKDISIKKGKKYKIKFDIKSSKMPKYVFFKVSGKTEEQFNFGKWIDCKKGKKIKVNASFKAKYDGNSVYFGIGGDCGDRAKVKTDKDAKERYKLAPNKKLDASRLKANEFAKHGTVITCRKFSLKSSGGELESPKMTQGILILDKGEKTVVKLAGVKGKVKWTASNKKLVKIRRVGKNKVVVKAKKTGNTTIIAKYKKKKYKCRIAIF